MNPSDLPLDELLELALKISNRSERDTWLQTVCGDDLVKLREIQSLALASEKTLWIDTPLNLFSDQEPSAELFNGLQVGPFEIVRRIGKGGMGEVFLARQHQPVRRSVAIKLIQHDLDSEEILKRFRSEQQTLANMEHPNIARIIDAGVTDFGSHYIAMEYVQGKQLLDYCASGNLNVPARINLILQCCRAIQHAHQKGTIHRDIKPNNILVTTVDSDPLVKVIDFGIAKAMSSNTVADEFPSATSSESAKTGRETTTGVSPGTPRYMSPEQYFSNARTIDTRSDIYSLGAVLYHVLVNVPPFDDLPIEDLSIDEIRNVISQQDPTLPSKRNPEFAHILRGDLDAIVVKAMQRNPEQRYQAVSELHDDLSRYLRDLPIQANPESRWTHLRRLTKRNKILIAASLLAILGLLSGFVISLIEGRKAIASERRASRQAYGADLLVASMAISKRNFTLSSEILQRRSAQTYSALSGSTLSSEPPIAWRLLRAQLPEEPKTILQVPTKIYFGLQMGSPGEVAAGCKDSHLRIVDKSTGHVRIDIDTGQKEINGLALSPDQTILATAGDDGTVQLWDVAAGNRVAKFHASDEPIFQISWTADGKSIVTAGNAQDVKIWDAEDFQIRGTISSQGEALECLSVGSNGAIAFGSDKGVTRIARFNAQGELSVQNVSVFMSRSFNVNRCSTVVFSPSSRMLAVGLDNGYLVLLQERQGSYQVVERIRFSTTVTAISFWGDETKIAIGENSGAVHVLNLPDQWPTRSRLRFTQFFLDESVKLLGPSMVTTPEGLWGFIANANPSDAQHNVPLELDRVYLEFNKPLKNILFSDNYVREWFDDQGNSKPSWSEMPKNVIFKDNGIELQFENRYGGYSGTVDLESQGRLKTWVCHSKRVSSIAWDDRENQVISFSEDGSIKSIQTDLSSTTKIGGDNIVEFLPATESHVYISTVGDRTKVVTLGKHHAPLDGKSGTFDESMICLGLFPSRKDCFLFANKPESSATAASTRTYFLSDLRNQQTREIVKLPDGFNPIAVVGEISQDCIAVIAREYQDLQSLPELDSNQLPSPVRERYLACWDLSHSKVLWRTPATQDEFRLPKTSQNGSYLSFILERKVMLLDCKTGNQHELGDFSGMQIASTCFSADGKQLLVAIADNMILCFETQTGDQQWALRTPGSPISDLAWSKDLETIVCVSQDGYLRMFDVGLLQMTIELPLPTKHPTTVKLPPEEDWIYVLGKDGSLIRIPCGQPIDAGVFPQG